MGTMGTNKQRGKVISSAAKEINNGKWLKEFQKAIKDKNLTTAELLFFRVAPFNRELADWAKHRINIMKGLAEESAAIKKLQTLRSGKNE